MLHRLDLIQLNIQVCIDFVKLTLDLHLLLHKVRLVLLRLLQIVSYGTELLQALCVCGRSLIQHRINSFKCVHLVRNLLMLLLELILPSHLLLEHPIQICMRDCHFSLHLFDHLLERVLRGFD